MFVVVVLVCWFVGLSITDCGLAGAIFDGAGLSVVVVELFVGVVGVGVLFVVVVVGWSVN